MTAAKKLCLVGLLALLLAGCEQIAAAKATPSPTPTPEPLTAVSALSRLQPTGEIHRLAAPVGHSNEPLKELLVEEGDKVSKGQLLAVMDSQALIQAQIKRAEADIERAIASRARVAAGPKSGEVIRQEAEIQRLARERNLGLAERDIAIRRARESEATAKREWERYRNLVKDGAVSRSVYDQKESEFKTLKRQREEQERARQTLDSTLQAGLRSARGELSRIQEIRPTDLGFADSEVAVARAEVERLKADLAKTKIYSPVDGTVLEILARVGETPTDGVLEVGQIEQMIAVAEIHQQDIGRVRLGQEARVQSPAFSAPIPGKVQRIGMRVQRQRVFSNIPGENFDQRVVEVEILLDMSAVPEVRRLSNLQAEAIIEVGLP